MCGCIASSSKAVTAPSYAITLDGPYYLCEQISKVLFKVRRVLTIN